MKLTAIFLLFFSLNLSARGFSQEKINLRIKKASIASVLLNIEKQTNYRFLYDEDLIGVRKKISVNIQDAAITDALNVILEENGLFYQFMDNKLVVVKQDNSASTIVNNFLTITGTVRSPSGEPMLGASVTVKGTSLGTSTDAEGHYSIEAPADATLVFSSVGFATQEIAVNGRTSIDVTMQETVGALNEVVVIGYGSANKRDLTGSITKIEGREVADKPNTNPVASMQGKVAGLSVVNSGQPGQEPDIRIRGTISRYQTKPLYVVDGIFNDNINYINPADIESIEVLKDPSSLAIFGVRGANGVIIVTTKKGKGGQLTVNLTSSIGVKKIVDKPELTDAAGFKALYDEQRMNQGLTPYPYYGLFQGNSNWIDLVAKENAIVSNNNLSITSGTEKNKFYMGVGYIREEGLIKYENLEKILLSVNDELSISKHIKIGFNINGYRAMLPQLHSFSSALIATPIVEPFNSTYGVYNKLPEEIGGPQIGNPVMGVEETKYTSRQREYRAVGSIFAEVNFLKNFTLRANFLGDLGFNDGTNYTPLINVYAAEIDAVAPQGGFTRSAVSQYKNSYSKFQQDYLLTYKKKFGDHNLTLLGGFTTYYDGYSGISGNVLQYVGRDPIPNNKRWWYLNVFPYGDPTTRTSNSEQWERTTASYLVRGLYSYRGKYLLNASFRRDGSSEISPANRFENFWAVGAAWELTREDFMADQQIFDFLKIKVSAGKLGNQYTGIHYPYYPNYVPGQSAVFGENIVPAYILAYRNDPNLKWETVTSIEGGIELVTLKNRLRFEANYYHKLTNDLLTFVETGSDQFFVNSGQIENKGIEAVATWSDETSNGIGYSISGNITTLNNKVKKVYTDGFDIISGPSRVFAGEPIGYFYGYRVDGVFQSNADKGAAPVHIGFGNYYPGDLKFKDIDGNDTVDVRDRTIIGNPTPDFIYGFSLSANYKGFDISIDCQGVYGNEIWRSWGNGNSFAQFNYRAARLDRWTGPGTSNWEPRVSDLASINRENSTYMIEDGSYFRIRNIQIGYNFKGAGLKKANIQSLRVFVNGQNLKTWKHTSGFTPEAGGSPISFGIDSGGYPIPAIATFGVNVTF